VEALKILRAVNTVKIVQLLRVLKALGDETRLAMYRELAAATQPLTAHDLSDRLGLHANTVRLHLERLRDASLVDVGVVRRGTVGRPQHVYSLAPGAPSLGLEPPASTVLGGLLAALAERSGASGDDAAAIGHGFGAKALRRTRSRSCLQSLHTEMSRLGFEPATEPDGTMAFLRCPFRELAEAYPELVCNLHRGICEGVVETAGGGRVERFATLYDRDPCHVAVTEER
jgi:predicted ArsR family transcriptional regulator